MYLPTPLSALHAMLEYIQVNIRKEITLHDLEGVSRLSRFQIIRLFSNLTGHTPITYIRARKLSLSLPQLLAGDTVLDVALDWGFEYEQSYIRAFRSEFGITPARYRRGGQALAIVSPPALHGLTVSANGLLGTPQVLVRPAFSLYGDVRAYNYAANELCGQPLLDGIGKRRAGLFIGASRAREGERFTHEYLFTQALRERNAPKATVSHDTWHYPTATWVQFQYMGLHALDAQGAQRMRLLAALVIGNWYGARHMRWRNAFIEQADLSLLSESYCEVTFLCPVEGN